MYNYCDKGYDNTNKKINDFSKKHPYCYIQGPTARCNKSSIYIFKW